VNEIYKILVVLTQGAQFVFFTAASALVISFLVTSNKKKKEGD
jgi:hypothetical protein